MSVALFTTLWLIVAVILLIYKYLTYHLKYWTDIGLPGPKPRILFGNFPSLITGKGFSLYELDDIYSQYKSKHRAIGVFTTRNPEIVILDPKLAQDVMITNFGKFRSNLANRMVADKRLDKICAQNPFFATGDVWKTKRAELVAGLTSNKLSLAYPIFKGSSQKLSNFLKQLTSNGNAEIEVKYLTQCFTADLMGDFLWGIDADTFGTIDSFGTTEPNQFVRMGQKMLKQSFRAIERFYALSLIPFLRPIYKIRFFPAETDQFFSLLTKEAKILRQENDMNSKRADFLNYVLQLQSKKNLSHTDIVGLTMTTMLDGYETSAVVLAHTLFYLTKYPIVQQQLRAEILEYLDDDGFMSFDNLNTLPFLDQCVHETIRLITPIQTYSKICTEATHLEVESGKSIPIKKNTVLIIPVFSYHHDPDYFPQPYEYNPARFDNAGHVEMNKQGIFIPFGDGPRICIGMRLGLSEVKSGLVEILKQYRIKNTPRTMAEKKPDSAAFILGLAGDFWLEFERI